MLLGEDRRHSLTVIQALPRHRHRNFKATCGTILALAHLLLDCFRQHFHLMNSSCIEQAECTGISPDNQYVRIKCAPPSSAALALGPAPALAGTPRNRSAATDFSARVRSARSS